MRSTGSMTEPPSLRPAVMPRSTQAWRPATAESADCSSSIAVAGIHANGNGGLSISSAVAGETFCFTSAAQPRWWVNSTATRKADPMYPRASVASAACPAAAASFAGVMVASIDPVHRVVGVLVARAAMTHVVDLRRPVGSGGETRELERIEGGHAGDRAADHSRGSGGGIDLEVAAGEHQAALRDVVADDGAGAHRPVDAVPERQQEEELLRQALGKEKIGDLRAGGRLADGSTVIRLHFAAVLSRLVGEKRAADADVRLERRDVAARPVRRRRVLHAPELEDARLRERDGRREQRECNDGGSDSMVHDHLSFAHRRTSWAP